MPELPAALKLETLLSQMPSFQPVAYYDKHLDVIRVQILDCSIWEERSDRIMTLYHMNHHPAGEGPHDIVGFAIKGLRSLLVEFGMETDGAIKIAELLDELVKRYPSVATRAAIEIFKELGKKVPQSAEVPRLEAAALEKLICSYQGRASRGLFYTWAEVVSWQNQIQTTGVAYRTISTSSAPDATAPTPDPRTSHPD